MSSLLPNVDNSFLLSELPRCTAISAGKILYFTEDVFMPVDNQCVFAGTRRIIAMVHGESSVPGFLKLRAIKSDGPNFVPAGATIERPVNNVLNAYDCSVAANAWFQAGGHLEGYENGQKVIMDNTQKGGVAIGSTHANDGIKGIVTPDNRSIEVENNEIHLNPRVNDDVTMYSFEGQKMTGKQIAAKLNVANGGVNFAKGGNIGTPEHPITYQPNVIILTAPVYSDTRKFEFEGKKMTPREIASHINEKNGGVSFAEGGTTGSCMCTGGKYNFGGSTLTDFQVIDKLNSCDCQHEIGYREEKTEHYDTLSKLNAGSITIDGALKEIVESHLKKNPQYYFKHN